MIGSQRYRMERKGGLKNYRGQVKKTEIKILKGVKKMKNYLGGSLGMSIHHLTFLLLRITPAAGAIHSFCLLL